LLKQANKKDNPGPGYYDPPIGFSEIQKKLDHSKQLKNQGFGEIDLIKKSPIFVSKQNRF
jgi:hypothetical protein